MHGASPEPRSWGLAATVRRVARPNPMIGGRYLVVGRYLVGGRYLVVGRYPISGSYLTGEGGPRS